jgi:hypothetical protein
MVSMALGAAPMLAQDASPAAVTGEVLSAITVPPETIPVGLEKIPVDQWTVAPGIDVVMTYDNEAIRGRGCLVRSGSLVVVPVVDALLWRAADAVGGPSAVTPGGAPVTLEAGDVLLLPAVPEAQVGPVTGIGLANPPGSTEAIVFCFHLHQPGGQFSGWPDGIESTAGVTHSDQLDMQATEANGALFRLTRLALPAGGSVSLPADAAYAIYTPDAGRIRSSAGGPAWSAGMGLSLSARTDPPTQVEVAGDEPAVVMELAVIPVGEPEPAAPSPSK